MPSFAIENIILLGLVSFSCAVYLFTEEDCPPNEEYICGTSCSANCTSPDPTSCSGECTYGCFCEDGYLRHDNGTCVPVDQCGGQKPICSANEEFLSCGAACPATCSQPQPVCGLACSMGCFCKSGFFRDETTKNCVTLEQCPVEQCFNENEVYDICNAACEPSCSDPEPICTQICSGGCICAQGLLRNTNGSCVSVDKCPQGNGTNPGLLGKYLDAINRIIHLTVV